MALANGATTLMFEGVPNYPIIRGSGTSSTSTRSTSSTRADRDPRADAGRRRPGQEDSRKSLRLLGSVGEPINPEAWEWYHPWSAMNAARSSTPVADRNRGILITPLPARQNSSRLGGKTVLRRVPEIVDADGKVLEAKPPAISASPNPGRTDAHRLWRP